MKSNLIRVPSLHSDLEERSEALKPDASLHRQTCQSFTWADDSFSEATQQGGKAELDAILARLKEVGGFIAAAVADAESGMAMATMGGSSSFNIEIAAAVNSEVIKAKLQAIKALGMSAEKQIEDILITLDTQYHLIRLYSKDPTIFIYLAVHKENSNLALARRSLSLAEQDLDL